MSSRRDPAVEAIADALDKGLRRAQEAIDRAARRNAGLLEKMAEHTGEKWLSDLAKNGSGPLWTQHRDEMAHLPIWSRLDAKLARRRAKQERKLERQKSKAERHKRHLEQQSIGAGLALLVASVAMGGMAFLHHELWWLLFPALGLGSGGANIVASKIGARKVQQLPDASSDSVPERVAAKDPRDARVDAVCTKILEELKNAAPSVKELVGKSDKTIEQLRATCRSLTQRERELHNLLDPADDARLAGEHDALLARIARESDEVVKTRLQGALEQLDAQRKQRSELAISAARFDAEHTRIAYTLESLFTQILRLKSADSAGRDPAGAALRQSLAQLGEEIEAVADAMESVNRDDLSPVSSVESTPGAANRPRERS